MKHNWKHIKFGDAFNLQMGKTPARANSAYWSNGLYDWVSISDMPNGKYIQGTKEKISQKAVDETGIHLVKKGTALMSFKLTIGKTAIAPYDLYTNEAIMAFEPKEGIDVLADFLYYYLQLYKWTGNRAVMGNTTNKGVIANSYASIPSLDEQQAIVRELDGINRLIDLQEEQLREYDRLAQSLFYTTFGDPVSNPKGWEVKKLGEVAEVVGGSTPKTSEEKNWIGTNNWISPAEIKDDDKYISSTERCISDDAASHLQLLPIGTVLLSSRAPIGKLAITRIPMYCNQGFKNIVCGKTLNNEYAYWYMKFNVGRLQEMGVGATFKEVSKTIVSAFPIMLPPLALQQTFAAQIEAIEQQKALIRKSLDETRTLLAARMQYYFE